MAYDDTPTTDPFLFSEQALPEFPDRPAMTFAEAAAKLEPWLLDEPFPAWVDLSRLKQMVGAVEAMTAGQPWRHGATVEYWDADCYLHRLDGPAHSCGPVHRYFIHGIEIDTAEEGIRVRQDGTLATPADHAIMAQLYQDVRAMPPDCFIVARGQSALSFYLYGE